MSISQFSEAWPVLPPPWVNHSWHVTLYVTSRGLTTGPIPLDLQVNISRMPNEVPFDEDDPPLQATYAAAADLSEWDRGSLERADPKNAR